MEMSVIFVTFKKDSVNYLLGNEKKIGIHSGFLIRAAAKPASHIKRIR